MSTPASYEPQTPKYETVSQASKTGYDSELRSELHSLLYQILAGMASLLILIGSFFFAQMWSKLDKQTEQIQALSGNIAELKGSLSVLTHDNQRLQNDFDKLNDSLRPYPELSPPSVRSRRGG
jgi:hypothetical protein